MNKTSLFTMGLAILFIVTLCEAQTDTTGEYNLQGKTGLSFLVNSNFYLSSYEGSLISYKKMIDNNHAWRVGLSLSGSHLVNEDEDNTSSNIGIGTNLSKVWYFQFDNSIRPYYGLGIQWNYNQIWNNSPLSDSKNITLSAGPIVYAGVEWFVSKRISFSGEYTSRIYYRYSYYKYSSGGESSNHSFHLSADEVRAGLTVYFSLPD